MEQSVIKKKGFSIIEALIAVTIFAIFSIGILYLSLDTIQRDSKIELKNEAVFYVQEGIEVIRNIRDRDFLSLTAGTYGLDFDGTSWNLTENPEIIDDFYTRTITIGDVYRDENGNITEVGVLDPETKKVISEVSWELIGHIPKSEVITTYLSNWPGDDWLTTTCTEYSRGIIEETLVVPMASPPVDNCALQLTSDEGSGDFMTHADFNKHANDVAVKGDYVFVAKNHESWRKSLLVLDFSDGENLVQVAELQLADNGDTIMLDGDYAYMGIEHREALTIVDITNPGNPQKKGVVTGEYGEAIDYSQGYAYLPSGYSRNTFRIVNVSNKNNPIVTANMNIESKKGNVAKVDGEYVYLGLDNDDEGLRIINVENPYNPVIVASIDVDEYGGNNTNAVNALEQNGIFLYVGTEDEHDQLKVLNIADPENPVMVNRLDVGGEIEDFVILENYLYAAVSRTDNGLAVMNISNPMAPTLAYTRDIYGKGRGITADENHVYIATESSNEGLVITETAEAAVTLAGTYTSEVFDTGVIDPRYNFIEWDGMVSAGGIIKAQVKTAAQAAELAGAMWVGPDGTNGTYYEISRTPIILDPERTGLRYFQYKLFLNSDGVTSPVIENIRINYTP